MTHSESASGVQVSSRGDRFGLGYYYMIFNDDRVELILPEDEEQGMEVFYKVAVTRWAEVSADLQVIDGALNGADTAVVGALRFRMSF